jgi:hypothetical protein
LGSLDLGHLLVPRALLEFARSLQPFYGEYSVFPLLHDTVSTDLKFALHLPSPNGKHGNDYVIVIAHAMANQIRKLDVILQLALLLVAQGEVLHNSILLLIALDSHCICKVVME